MATSIHSEASPGRRASWDARSGAEASMIRSRSALDPTSIAAKRGISTSQLGRRDRVELPPCGSSIGSSRFLPRRSPPSCSLRLKAPRPASRAGVGTLRAPLTPCSRFPRGAARAHRAHQAGWGDLEADRFVPRRPQGDRLLVARRRPGKGVFGITDDHRRGLVGGGRLLSRPTATDDSARDRVRGGGRASSASSPTTTARGRRDRGGARLTTRRRSRPSGARRA